MYICRIYLASQARAKEAAQRSIQKIRDTVVLTVAALINQLRQPHYRVAIPETCAFPNGARRSRLKENEGRDLLTLSKVTALGAAQRHPAVIILNQELFNEAFLRLLAKYASAYYLPHPCPLARKDPRGGASRFKDRGIFAQQKPFRSTILEFPIESFRNARNYRAMKAHALPSCRGGRDTHSTSRRVTWTLLKVVILKLANERVKRSKLYALRKFQRV